MSPELGRIQLVNLFARREAGRESRVVREPRTAKKGHGQPRRGVGSAPAPVPNMVSGASVPWNGGWPAWKQRQRTYRGER